MKKHSSDKQHEVRTGKWSARRQGEDHEVIDNLTVRRAEILSALRKGPVLRDLPAAYKPFTFVMAIHHLRNGGSWSSLAAAGIARSIYLAMAVVVTAMLLLAGGVYWAVTPPPPPVYYGVGLCLDPPHVVETGEYHSTIVEVLPGTPAQAAGLRAGDHIVEINGVSIGDPARPLFRGDPGTQLTLTIQRAGQHQLEQVTLTRSPIREDLYEAASERRNLDALP
jgi:hypothetical protein